MCSINNKGRVEHHLEFWILVAGDELDWVEYVSDESDDDGDALVNIVSMFFWLEISPIFDICRGLI